MRRPPDIWFGGDTSTSREVPLRAHRLVVDGFMTTTRIGRTAFYSSVEGQHWWTTRRGNIGAAAFLDLVSVDRRIVRGRQRDADVGVGLRAGVQARPATSGSTSPAACAMARCASRWASSSSGSGAISFRLGAADAAGCALSSLSLLFPPSYRRCVGVGPSPPGVGTLSAFLPAVRHFLALFCLLVVTRPATVCQMVPR